MLVGKPKILLQGSEQLSRFVGFILPSSLVKSVNAAACRATRSVPLQT
jgi:hypothetical protein